MLAGLGADVVKIELVGREDSMRNAAMIHGAELDDRGRALALRGREPGQTGPHPRCDQRSRSGDLPPAHRAGRRLPHEPPRQRAARPSGRTSRRLQAINPRLIYAQGEAWGHGVRWPRTPARTRSAWPTAGSWTTRSPSEDPNYPPGSMSDVLTGSNLASAVMAGLLERAQHGTGRTGPHVTAPVDAVAPVAAGRDDGVDRPTHGPFRAGRGRPPCTAPIRPTDGWIAIAAIHPHHWPPLARALGLDEPARRPSGSPASRTSCPTGRPWPGTSRRPSRSGRRRSGTGCSATPACGAHRSTA